MHAAVLALAAALVQTPDPAAVAIVDTALARMGGAAALRSIERVRYEMMTEWQRISFDDRPYMDLPSYERHTDLRDYTIPAWRNVRQFGARTVIDLVRDSVAVRDFGTGWQPLNVAYVDERRELFTYTPDRLVLLARAARDLVLLDDTLVDGMAHARVRGTMGDFPATVLFRKSDGLPAAMQFTAAHPNDYGLVPWGEMDVEVWYANWTTLPNGVHAPTQWNVRRVGRSYKRLTVLSTTLTPEVTPDTFAISEDLRAGFRATANRPMHDLHVDSATVTDGRLLRFHGFGLPAGAVRLGDEWLLLETGQAPLNAQRALRWLADSTDARVAGAVVGLTWTANGGVDHLVRSLLPVWAGPGSAPIVQTILENAGAPAHSVEMVDAGRWLRIGGDSAWVEPIDLPDARGSLAVWVPSLEWVFVAGAATPLDVSLVQAHALRRGWTVQRIGSFAALARPLPQRRD